MSFRTYSPIYIYNTNKPANLETTQDFLLKYMLLERIIYSGPAKDQLVFLNSLTFWNYLRALGELTSFRFVRVKAHANLFVLVLDNILTFLEFVHVMLELQKYPFFFVFPFIFRTYKITFNNLYTFYQKKLSLIKQIPSVLIMQFIHLIKAHYIQIIVNLIQYKFKYFNIFLSFLKHLNLQ